MRKTTIFITGIILFITSFFVPKKKENADVEEKRNTKTPNHTEEVDEHERWLFI